MKFPPEIVDRRRERARSTRAAAAESRARQETARTGARGYVPVAMGVGGHAMK
jgi:hypothetical protein